MEISIKKTARIIGMLYLFCLLFGLFTLVYIPAKIVVDGDAAATARNIMANRPLWCAGIVVQVLVLLSDIAISTLFYFLFRPINKPLALLTSFLRLITDALQCMGLLFLLSPLLLLNGDSYLKAFSLPQLQSFTMLASNLFIYDNLITLLFFGFHLILLGYLIYKSNYFPKVLSTSIVIAGACYLINSFSLFIFPAFDNIIFPFILVPSFVAECSLAIYLTIKGIKSSGS